MKKYFLFLALWLIYLPVTLLAQAPVKIFSTAGFYALENSGRTVESFNPGWRFFKGDIKGAEKSDFSDRSWEVVNLPHSVELVPSEASGCKNYQGIAWYRKHFVLPNGMRGKKMSLYFEAIMGKCKIYLNGKLVKENFGSYLPVILDLSKCGIVSGTQNVIAVCADNSDDPIYPPGKPQDALDFAYFGGIYRDVWLVATAPVHITDAIQSAKTAGGGVFIHYEDLSESKATVVVETEIKNESAEKQQLKLETVLKNAAGLAVGKANDKIVLAAGAEQKFKQSIIVTNPSLWHPDNPYLYNLNSIITTKDGKPVDGFYNRIGIRKIEFRGKDGFYLNNKPFNDKLIGGNRHQDFAYVGNALPNSGQWRDAKKLRDAGMRIIRSAHYPQDPSFMDACDELGLFVIVATPGWQFWNADTIFARRIYTNISNMVRRDRNHASVIMWEPILNETRFPESFSRNAYDLLHAEYPFQGCFAACDDNSKGADFYDVIYAHPYANDAYKNIKQSVFTREWGDNVDDWSSHNSPSRVSRDWGEVPQLIQSMHYANPSYPFTCFQTLYQTPAQHIGGCLWHPFDHQRGYHPDPFWGGIMDAFRQTKFSYYMFQSQRDPKIKHPTADSGPMIYIANEMTPFSPNDVTVYTNCEQVKLTFFNKEPLIQKVEHTQPGMPYQPVIFKNAYHFMDIKAVQRGSKKQIVNLRAEGLIDNKVVATAVRMPAKRPDKIMLSIDNEGLSLIADGSDFVTVIASITDNDGNVKRLNKEKVKFTIEGEGEIIGDERIGANPRVVEWGTAPVLIRSTTRPGKIKITATIAGGGSISPRPATIELESMKPVIMLNYTEEREALKGARKVIENESQGEVEQLKEQLQKAKDELNKYKLKEVEADQEFFEGKKPVGKIAAKPLFRDPVYDGAADPMVIWNKKTKSWFMFYTNRRASDSTAKGVSWVHDTRIGVAESKDGGASWKYKDTADIQYRKGKYTFWAPEIVEHNDLYHMYLTYVPGVFNDWNHPREIIHLTSTDLMHWKYESTLQLATNKVIDACIYQMPNGIWRMWYNNESDHKSIYYADSKDLYTWEDKGKAISDMAGEGPNVFRWKDQNWMIVDNWKGMGVYSSSDFLNWKRQQEMLLQQPGTGKDDEVMGGHADVVVDHDRAYVFYFTHPGRKVGAKAGDGYESRRSSIQVVELEYKDGIVTCNRNKPQVINLQNQ